MLTKPWSFLFQTLSLFSFFFNLGFSFASADFKKKICVFISAKDTCTIKELI